MEDIPPAAANRAGRVVLLLNNSNVPDAFFLQCRNELGVLLLDILEQLMTVYDWGAAAGVRRHVAVEAYKLGVVLILGQFVVQGDWLCRRALVCCEHLQRFWLPCTSNNQVSHGCATNILELAETELMQDGNVLVGTQNIKSAKQNGSYVRNFVQDSLSVGLDSLLERDKASAFIWRPD